MKSEDRPISILYVTREAYPTYRVDLTELFSQQLTHHGFVVQWVMEGPESGAPVTIPFRQNESFSIRKRLPPSNGINRAVNKLGELWRDFSVVFVGREFDVIQVRDKVTAAFFGLLGARRSGARFVYWMSWPFPETYLERARTEKELPRLKRAYFYVTGLFTRWLLYRHVLPRSDHVFVQSEQMKADVARHDIALEKMTPVPMGVADASLRFRADPCEAFPMDRERPTIAYLGTLDLLRGLDFLIEVFLRVKQKLPECQLLLIGDSTDDGQERLGALVREHELEDDVLITGMIERNKAWTYIVQSDLCVSLFRPNPILWSASPTKLVEYMALGKPVVVNDQPDQKTLVSESRCGEVVAYDQHEMAEAVLRILSLPDRGRNIGERGRSYIEQHRVYSILAQEVADTYRRVVERRGPEQV